MWDVFPVLKWVKLLIAYSISKLKIFFFTETWTLNPGPIACLAAILQLNYASYMNLGQKRIYWIGNGLKIIDYDGKDDEIVTQ